MGFFSKFKEKISKQVEKAGENFNKAVKDTGEAFRFKKVREGLEKTRKSFVENIQAVLGAGRKIDDQLLEEIEEILLTADIGVVTSEQLIENLKKRVRKEGLEKGEDVYSILKDEMHEMLLKSPSAENDANYAINEAKKPHTILVIGVNGVGKTTTIGKLAYNYKMAGREVIIGAADTFRAAANEQLEIWAERAGVKLIQQRQGADPSAVVFDTMKSAESTGADVVLIDTAGRLHNKTNLMKELEKMTRVMQKTKENAPDDVYLVLDATTGQNAILQAKEFTKVANITGIVLTKLDGTAKGGVVIPIANELKIPVRYIGVGEKIDDLQVFDPTFFTGALFGTTIEEAEEKEG